MQISSAGVDGIVGMGKGKGNWRRGPTTEMQKEKGGQIEGYFQSLWMDGWTLRYSVVPLSANGSHPIIGSSIMAMKAV